MIHLSAYKNVDGECSQQSPQKRSDLAEDDDSHKQDDDNEGIFPVLFFGAHIV